MVQIHLQIPAGRSQIFVSEPLLEGVGFDSGGQEVYRRGVAKTMGRNFLPHQAGTDLGGAGYISFNQGPHAEPGEGPPPLVDEEAGDPVSRGPSIFLFIDLKDFGDVGHQGGGPLRFPLPHDLNGALAEIEPGVDRIDDFLSARSGVVHERQYGEVAKTVLIAQHRLGKYRLQFFTGQGIDGCGRGFFLLNGEDLPDQAPLAWNIDLDVMEKLWIAARRTFRVVGEFPRPSVLSSRCCRNFKILGAVRSLTWRGLEMSF